MNTLIAEAVREKRVITFRYKDVQRMVEPHTYGVDKDGTERLAAWQLSGKFGERQDWRYFEVQRMIAVQNTEQKFANARPKYVHNDSRMKVIYAQI